MKVRAKKPVVIVLQPGQEATIADEQFKLIKDWVVKVEDKEEKKETKKKTKKG